MSSVPTAPPHKGGDWLDTWNPEDAATWDSGRAWKTLWITTFNLTLAFITWFLVSAIAPQLNNIGFDLSKGQLYWLAAMPGLAGGLVDLILPVEPIEPNWDAWLESWRSDFSKFQQREDTPLKYSEGRLPYYEMAIRGLKDGRIDWFKTVKNPS